MEMHWLSRIAILTIAAIVCLVPQSSPAAAPGEEQRLVDILQSNKPPREKGAACVRLKRIGTARSVRALAALLESPELSHSARYALESMGAPEAGAALLTMLAKTSGLTRVGLIDSLGNRREPKAVGPLVKLLTAKDAVTASAAATALGKIGGGDAVKALRTALPKAPAKVKTAVLDAMLRCGDRMLATNDAKGAHALYRELYANGQPRYIRQAAFGGLVRSAGKRGADLVVKALTGTDQVAQLAAVPFVREIKGRPATEAFAAVLPKVQPGLQVALLESLAQRRDITAGPAVKSAAGSSVGSVRLAALKALAVLGDASSVGLLAEAAASTDAAVQGAARRSLAVLRHGKVREAILAQLPKSSAAVQTELVRALAARDDTEAIPVLLKMAAAGDESVCVAAVRAISVLGGDSDVEQLVRLVVGAKTQPTRDAIVTALMAICRRSKRPGAHGATILAAMGNAGIPARCSLLRAAGPIGGPAVLRMLRAGVSDKEPAVRDAAIHTMAESGGLETAPDLLELARQASVPAHRIVAMRGYWRVVGLADKLPAERRLKMCQSGLTACRRTDDKCLALAELAKVPHPEALKLADKLRGDKPVRAEAETACVQIAASLVSGYPAEAKAALASLASSVASKDVRARAAKALASMDRYVGYITAWQVAGPYRQKGKECSQLFDIPFAPEQSGKDVVWKPVPRPADASLSWQADLGSIVGGNHCVVYLRTRVHCPEAKRVRLDIGTDDGIRMWVNVKVVHANNAIRGLTPDQDKARAVLKKGRNDFLLKITQHTQGCGACVRIRNTDGTVIEGLRFDVADSLR